MKKINVLIHDFCSLTNGIIRKFNESELPCEIYTISFANNTVIKQTYLGSPKEIKISELKEILKEKEIDFVICFAEDRSLYGFVDFYKKTLKMPVIGCTKKWFMLEASKLEGKKFMTDFGIKTPQFIQIQNKKELNEAIDKFGLPIVIKNNDLMAGFGTYICKTKIEAEKHVKDILKNKHNCIAEKFISGSEITQQYIWDEKNLIALQPVKDYKTSEKCGINTGGMGCYTPVYLTCAQEKMLIDYNEHLRFLFNKLKPDFTGIFAVNLLFSENELYTLEFNMRPGITEFQTLIENMDCDLLELLYNTAHNNAAAEDIKYKNAVTGCVNIVHKDYITQKNKKTEIDLAKIVSNTNSDIKLDFNLLGLDINNKAVIYTNKIILSVLSTNKCNPFPAIYEYIKKIEQKNLYYRKDIGDNKWKKTSTKN